MKIFISILLFIFTFSYAADEDLMDEDLYISSQTYENTDSEEGQMAFQESEEDIANFVEDYIKKDIALKKYFLIEDNTGKILKLNYIKIKKIGIEKDGKKVNVEFKDTNSKIYEIDFYITGMWGNLDISKIVLKKSEIIKKEKEEKQNKKVVNTKSSK